MFQSELADNVFEYFYAHYSVISIQFIEPVAEAAMQTQPMTLPLLCYTFAFHFGSFWTFLPSSHVCQQLLLFSLADFVVSMLVVSFFIRKWVGLSKRCHVLRCLTHQHVNIRKLNLKF